MDFLKSSEVDVAYYILTQSGEKMYYKDLVLEVIEKTHKPVQSLSALMSCRKSTRSSIWTAASTMKAKASGG